MKIMMRYACKILFLMSILGGFKQTFAAPSCNVSIPQAVNFGTYAPFSTTANESTGTVQISCSGSGRAKYTISLSTGQSGNYLTREMLNISGGSSLLEYNLYTTAARNKIWGDGSGNTNVVSKNKKSPFTEQHTIYGTIPALQTQVEIATYSDSILVTVDY